jgi:hypothetical protein
MVVLPESFSEGLDARGIGLINSTQRAIRRGSFSSVKELITKIKHFISQLQQGFSAFQLECDRRFDPGEAQSFC